MKNTWSLATTVKYKTYHEMNSILEDSIIDIII